MGGGKRDEIKVVVYCSDNMLLDHRDTNQSLLLSLSCFPRIFRGPFPQLPQHNATMNASQKTMDILVRTERTADRILQINQELVMLDRRRQDLNEALREMRTKGTSNDATVWLTIGSMLVKMRWDKAIELQKKGAFCMLDLVHTY